ncbi:mRNA-capping enzyme subunit beta [Pestalotiopsis sp. NC0098]|nr:mRNA-capping enzyme subunit beta [Pestalotiopsis sp. NC0098]
MPTASPSMASAPHTPIQPRPHRGLRDYNQPVHGSPSQAPAPPPNEYHAGHPPPGPPGAYVSPTTQHPPANAFTPRPAPPPLQPPGPNHDPRSPGSAQMSGPSPYRHTPTSSLNAGSQGYPFPPTHVQNQLPASPQQRHQYGPPSNYPRDSRDSFASPGGPVPPPIGMPSGHGSAGYFPGQQAMPPQTPPVTTPGGSQHPYMQPQQPQHQRSQSLQSTSTATPTSAHPQPFGTPYGPQTGSPATTTRALSQFDHRDQRQSSQPPTPLGPPAAPRQVSAQYPQPQSPYQQRMSSVSVPAPPQSPYSTHPLQQIPPQSQSHHRSPSVPHAVATNPQSQPQPNTHYDAAGDPHRRSQSYASQERERSISVSPKTRIPSLTDSLASAPASVQPRPSSMSGDSADQYPHHQHHQHQQSQLQQALPPSTHVPAMKREGTPAKRKLDDRDLHPEELDGHARRPPPPQLNGTHGTPSVVSQPSSPAILRRKKKRFTQPPVWAQSGKARQPNSSRNYTLKSKAHVGGGSHEPQTNGDAQSAPAPESKVKLEHAPAQPEHASRHTSPEVIRKAEEQPIIGPDNKAWKLLDGRPFAVQSISLSLPIDHLVRVVADFLFQYICLSEFAGEVKSRGIQWEVEAKLGTIIDRNTNSRVAYPVNGECALTSDARVAFRSSMTQAQHRGFNEWLNANLATTHPQNPHTKPYEHVPISYKHRREVDEFYELPPPLVARLPSALTALQQSKQSVKGRVSRDQQTGEILAKIVKARVADLNIHLPMARLDCRISINLEWDWDGPAEELIRGHPTSRDRQPDRAKDRMSYSQGHFQVDLTQVSQANPRSGALEKEHELEVEMNTTALIEQGNRARSEEPNLYPELVETFVNNIRALARNCPE